MNPNTDQNPDTGQDPSQKLIDDQRELNPHIDWDINSQIQFKVGKFCINLNAQNNKDVAEIKRAIFMVHSYDNEDNDDDPPVLFAKSVMRQLQGEEDEIELITLKQYNHSKIVIERTLAGIQKEAIRDLADEYYDLIHRYVMNTMSNIPTSSKGIEQNMQARSIQFIRNVSKILSDNNNDINILKKYELSEDPINLYYKILENLNKMEAEEKIAVSSTLGLTIGPI